MRADPADRPDGPDGPGRVGPPRTAASRTVFVDGAFVPAAEARVSVMDRGFLFADGVYEVSAVLDGALVDNDAHLARLHRSLGEIGIPDPHGAGEWRRLQDELVRRNGLDQGSVYVQVTRGVAERDFGYAEDLAPTVVMFTQAKDILAAPVQRRGAAVVTVPDLRWARRDIKSTGLLAQVMAKRVARAAGAAEALLVEDGFITEGGSSSVLIVTRDGRLATRPSSRAVLPGVTRLAAMRLAREAGLVVEERPVSVEEAMAAAEVMLTSATTFVVPVVSIDGRPVGDGAPGPRARRLMDLYVSEARAARGRPSRGDPDEGLDRGARAAPRVSSARSIDPAA